MYIEKARLVGTFCRLSLYCFKKCKVFCKCTVNGLILTTSLLTKVPAKVMKLSQTRSAKPHTIPGNCYYSFVVKSYYKLHDLADLVPELLLQASNMADQAMMTLVS